MPPKTVKDEVKTVEEKYKVGKRVKVAVIVSVQKDNLRKFLESAGIIRKFGLD